MTVVRFGDLHIRHDRRVLAPRPWTRTQSEWAAELARDAPVGAALELGTGAGHIGLLFTALTGREVVAIDADPVAAAFARDNAAVNDLAERFEVRAGPMAEAVAAHERFAIVLADPPWVQRAETGRFPDDPVRAIDGGADGLDVARVCLGVAARHLLTGGSMVLQLGTARQAETIGADLPGDLRVRDRRSCPGGVLVHLSKPG